jgi:hypothetical protein
VKEGEIPAIDFYNKLGYRVKLAVPHGFSMVKNVRI